LEEQHGTYEGPQQIPLLLGVRLPGLRAKRAQLVTLGTAFPESSTGGFSEGHCSPPQGLLSSCGSHLRHPPELQTWLPSVTSELLHRGFVCHPALLP